MNPNQLSSALKKDSGLQTRFATCKEAVVVPGGQRGGQRSVCVVHICRRDSHVRHVHATLFLWIDRWVIGGLVPFGHEMHKYHWVPVVAINKKQP